MATVLSISEAIDSAWEANAKGPRPHLGASQIGKPCERMLVYSFRHAAVKKHKGRMLRLFDRGHKEEPSLIASLRMIGLEVREYAQRLGLHKASETYQAFDWDNPTPDLWNDEYLDVTHIPEHVAIAKLCGVELKQWSFKDIGGHHAGSTDGMARNPSDNVVQFSNIPADTWFALEFKTYNTKSFLYLLDKRVLEAKPEHYWQMQEYMHYMGLPLCLYVAINKNDDSLYDEVVPYNPVTAERAIEKARTTIAARQLPRRISENPTNFTCKYCDYKGPCHFGEPMLKSCRSCTMVSAITEGTEGSWFCSKWNAIIPPDVVKQGCDVWSPITD